MRRNVLRFQATLEARRHGARRALACMVAMAITLATALVACTKSVTPAARDRVASLDSAALRQALLAAEARAFDALRHQDVAAIASLLEREAILLTADGRAIRGRAAMAAVAARSLRDVKGATVTDAMREVLVQGEGVVATSAATLRLERATAPPDVRRLAFTTVWRRQADGELRISLAVDRGAAVPAP